MNTVDGGSTMGMAEFARHLAEHHGVQMSRQAVSKSQVIPKVEVGGGRRVVPVAEALLALQAQGRLQLGDEIPAPVPAAPAAAAVTTSGRSGRPPVESGGGGYYDEKAKTERVSREIQEIKLAKLRGELVEVAAVSDALTEAARRFGERLEQLSGLAGELAAVARDGGEPALRAKLREQVRALRQAMADDLGAALGDHDHDDDEDEGNGDE